MTRTLRWAALAALLIAAGTLAAVALAQNSPPGQGDCGHGNTNKPCKPDPQPGHGKDCDEHGNHGGVNEDHCAGETTPPPTVTEPPPTTTEPPPTVTDPPPTVTTPPTSTSPPTSPIPPVTTSPSVPPVTTTAPPVTTTAPPRTENTTKQPKPIVKTSSRHKTVKLTGNPVKDKCVPRRGGVFNCKGIIVVAGQG